MLEIQIMTQDSEYWNETIRLAENCSWRAGKLLAARMKENSFEEFERVLAVTDEEKIAAFCTFAKKDELPEEHDFSPFVGFVFVSEEYRGQRLSQRMIDAAEAYAKQLGFSKLYILSGEIGLYEKYGFRKIGDYDTLHGTRDQLFVRNIT